MFKDKGLLAGIIFTIVIIVGGIFFFTKTPSPESTKPEKINDSVLAPESAFKTSGIKDNQYQPASSSAQITLVEFGDYECPACSLYSTLVKQLITEFQGQINLVFRNFPLPQHKNAPLASYAAEAAGLQGKFWEMHEKLYATQKDWAASSEAGEIFKQYASTLGLNMEQFTSDLNSSNVKDKVDRDSADANLIKVNSTPTFYINGEKIENLPASYEELKKLITDRLAL